MTNKEKYRDVNYKKRCGKCKWLETGKCFECDMRYDKFEPAHKDAKWMMTQYD